jgi:hypothetical protein
MTSYSTNPTQKRKDIVDDVGGPIQERREEKWCCQDDKLCTQTRTAMIEGPIQRKRTKRCCQDDKLCTQSRTAMIEGPIQRKRERKDVARMTSNAPNPKKNRKDCRG